MLASTLIDWCNSVYEREAVDGSETISDALWISYFNDALTDLLPDLNIEEVSVTDIVDETPNYALPSDFYQMRSVLIYSDTGDDEADEYTEQSPKDISYVINERVTGYALWDGEIYLSPCPEDDITSGLKILYYKKPAELTAGTDTVPISDPYILGEYALYQAETGDRVTDMAERHFNKYMLRKENLFFESGVGPITPKGKW